MIVFPMSYREFWLRVFGVFVTGIAVGVALGGAAGWWMEWPLIALIAVVQLLLLREGRRA